MHLRCIKMSCYELFKPIVPAVSATDIFHNRQQWARRPLGSTCVNELLTQLGVHGPKCSDHHKGHQCLLFLLPDLASTRDCHVAAVSKQHNIQPPYTEYYNKRCFVNYWPRISQNWPFSVFDLVKYSNGYGAFKADEAFYF